MQQLLHSELSLDNTVMIGVVSVIIFLLDTTLFAHLSRLHQRILPRCQTLQAPPSRGHRRRAHQPKTS